MPEEAKSSRQGGVRVPDAHCWAGLKTEVVARFFAESARDARCAAPAGEGPAWGASCVPIRNGRVTKRSASAWSQGRARSSAGHTAYSLAVYQDHRIICCMR